MTRDEFDAAERLINRLKAEKAQLQAQLSEAQAELVRRKAMRSSLHELGLEVLEDVTAECAALREAAQAVSDAELLPATSHGEFLVAMDIMREALSAPGPGAAFLERFRRMEAAQQEVCQVYANMDAPEFALEHAIERMCGLIEQEPQSRSDPA